MPDRVSYPPAVTTHDRSAAELEAIADWLDGKGSPARNVQHLAPYIPSKLRMPLGYTPPNQRGSSLPTRREWNAYGGPPPGVMH